MKRHRLRVIARRNRHVFVHQQLIDAGHVRAIGFIDRRRRHRSSSGTIARAVISGNIKGIFGEPEGPEEVYDLAVDPGELDNMAARHREHLAMLRGLLRLQRQQSAELHRRFGAESTEREVVLSESERERLRALGYVH